jgi:hypothetical protein
MFSGPFHFCDLEGRNWTRPLSAASLLDDGGEEYFAGEDSWKRQASVMRAVGGTWVAHFGGGYDFLLLFKDLGRPKRVIMSGSRLLGAEFFGGLSVLDSWPGFLCSLADIGKFVGLPKLDHDREKLAHLSAPDLRAYNMRDNHILKRGFDLASEVSSDLGMTRKYTAGSSAIEAIRCLEPDTWAALQANLVSVEDRLSLPASFAPGGRTECLHRGYVSGVNIHDVKSSYPSTYLWEEGMGAGLRRIEGKRALDSRWNDPHAVLKVSYDRAPTHEIASVISENGYGAGANLFAWTTEPERRLMGEDKAVTIRGCNDGYRPEVVLPEAFSHFAKKLFALKDEGVPFVKVWVNSAHGKFLERILKESFDWCPQNPYEPDFFPPKKLPIGLYRYLTLKTGKNKAWCDPHIQPINAALVYGRARSRLVRFVRDIQRAGYTVYYIDTDSVFTNAPNEIVCDIVGPDYGNQLGNLALEGGPYSGIILGRKSYYLEADAGRHFSGKQMKTAAKGLSLSKLKKSHFFRRKFWPTSSPLGKDRRADLFIAAEKESAATVRVGVTPFISGATRGEFGLDVSTRSLRYTDGHKVWAVDGAGIYSGPSLDTSARVDDCPFYDDDDEA